MSRPYRLFRPQASRLFRLTHMFAATCQAGDKQRRNSVAVTPGTQNHKLKKAEPSPKTKYRLYSPLCFSTPPHWLTCLGRFAPSHMLHPFVPPAQNTKVGHFKNRKLQNHGGSTAPFILSRFYFFFRACGVFLPRLMWMCSSVISAFLVAHSPRARRPFSSI